MSASLELDLLRSMKEEDRYWSWLILVGGSDHGARLLTCGGGDGKAVPQSWRAVAASVPN
jgi:hypothetical protein